MKSIGKLALGLVATVAMGGCSDPRPAARQRPARTSTAQLRPGPGAQIDALALGRPAPALAALPGAALALPDLGADRAPQRIRLPRIPRGSSAGFSFGRGNRGWITRLPEGGHLPSVAYGQGRVYASGGFDSRAVFALQASSGRLLWGRGDLTDNGPTAPIYLDGELIFNTESCTLFVLDARTGRTRWSRWLGDPTLAQPAVQHGLIYAAHPKKEGGMRLSALKLRNGAVAWSRAINGELLSAPVVAGDGVFATTVRGAVYRFAARSGKRRWVRARLGATSAPWVHGGRVFVSRELRGRVRQEAQLVLDAGSGQTLATIRQRPARYLRDVPRTSVEANWRRVWAFEGSRPLLHLGRMVDTMGGVVSAADPGTGRALWQRRAPGSAGRRHMTPPVVAGSQVIAVSTRGEVHALDIDTGMTVWAYRLDRKLASSPVVANGWVYLVGVDGSVIALRAGTSALDGWHMWGGGPTHNGA